jgi:hypothetical protein
MSSKFYLFSTEKIRENPKQPFSSSCPFYLFSDFNNTMRVFVRTPKGIFEPSSQG